MRSGFTLLLRWGRAADRDGVPWRHRLHDYKRGHGADARLLVIHIEPGLSDGGIGEIGLVEDFEARALAGQAHSSIIGLQLPFGMRASSTSTMTSITSIVLAASLRAAFM
jgi:hypothetical protein